MKLSKKLFASILIAFSTSSLYAQIPNNGFESWTNVGTYDNPDSWSTLNSITVSASTFTCSKGTPGNPGSSYLKLVSKSVTGMGIQPGIAFSGNFNPTTLIPTSGFPFAQRPANFTGSWQHMIYGTSQGFVDVQLTRWDANMNMRMVVATAHKDLTGMAMSWSNFTIPFTYTDGNNPDTCMITLSASGAAPTANDYLYVDNLAFTGTVAAITENEISKIKLYPNPAAEAIAIELNELKSKTISFEIFDMQGKKIKSVSELKENKYLDIAALATGNYWLQIVTDNGIIRKQFQKQ